jgi:hypothetical protein
VQVEAVITRTLESAPPEATHWSTRTMARTCKLSRATSRFAALDGATGKVIAKCQRRHRLPGFLSFPGEAGCQLPAELVTHAVMDNDRTRKATRAKRWYARHPRCHVHFSPTRASGLNHVERSFAEITQRRIRGGAFTHVRELEQSIQDCLGHHKRNPKLLVLTARANANLNRVS